MSADGASFTYRSVDFGGNDYGVYVVSREWPRLPKPRVNLSMFAQADGGVTQGSTFEPRRIKLKCMLAASNEANRNTQMANVVSQLALSQYTGPALLVVDYFPDLAWKNARLMDGIDSELAQNGEIFNLEFLADPWPVAAAATTETAIGITSGVAETIAGAGDIPVDAVWVFKNGGSDASGIVLANAATAETAIWPNTLPAGAWLRLSSDTQRFEVSENSGADWTHVPANSTGIIAQISGGEDNDVTITGASGTLDVTYTAGYRQ
jgi:hypothetical protein